MKVKTIIAISVAASATLTTALTTALLMTTNPLLRASTCGNVEKHFNRTLMELRVTTNNPVSVALWECSVSL